MGQCPAGFYFAGFDPLPGAFGPTFGIGIELAGRALSFVCVGRADPKSVPPFVVWFVGLALLLLIAPTFRVWCFQPLYDDGICNWEPNTLCSLKRLQETPVLFHYPLNFKEEISAVGE